MSEPDWIAYVILDGEEIRLDNVTFLNIEEDAFTGRDLITFEHEGKKHQSFAITRPC